MDQQEGLSSNRAPLFHGTNYAFWSIRMIIYLMALGSDTWQFIVNGYETPTTLTTYTTRKNICNDNCRAVTAILCGLENSKFVKVMHCKSTK